MRLSGSPSKFHRELRGLAGALLLGMLAVLAPLLPGPVSSALGAVPSDTPVLDRLPVDDVRPLDGLPPETTGRPPPSDRGRSAETPHTATGAAAPASPAWIIDPLLLAAAAALVLAALASLVLVVRHQSRLVESTRRDLMETRGRFRILFDSIHEGVVISRQGIILEANTAVASLADRPRDALIGLTLDSLVAPDDRETVRARVRSNDEAPVIVSVLRPDGTTLPVEAQARAMVQSDGPARLTTVRDISTRMRLEDRMRRLARVDTISECLNRRAFLDQGEVEFERFRRYGRILSILLVDVDDLRRINTEYGYQAGDAILRHLVRRCDALLRVTDAVGRYGGAECALLLPETPLAGAVNVGERLCAAVREDGAPFQERILSYVVRVGVAEVQPQDKSVITALERAEEAMRRAKREGRDLSVA